MVRRRAFVWKSAVSALVSGCARETVEQPAPRPAGSGVVTVGGADLSVVFDGEPPNLPRARYEQWVGTSAQMITDYYGGTLPVPDLEIAIVPRGRGGVGFGSHRRGRWIRVYVGRQTSSRSLERDWVMVHEMLHATFPDLTDEHRWMQEGLSTYLEKVVRVRAGNLTEAEVWERLSASMHHGRPRAGDRGLARTRTWGRTYWGGALFWMMADIELREQTDNRASLDTALLHIASMGANARQMWEPAQVCEACDHGTGTSTLSQLYDRMAMAPGDVDLDRLWQELGVIRHDDDSVSFDDGAPMAATRRGIANG
ncbi:MAG: hypothetical protein AAGA54_04620 [Myxococcota bacterium]